MALKMNESYGMLDRRRSGVLKKMARVGPFLMASLVEVTVKCGNPRCACAGKKEARHRKTHLVWSHKEGHGTLYVPVDLKEEVEQWVENYIQMKEYIKEMTVLSRKMIGLYVKTRKGRGGV